MRLFSEDYPWLLWVVLVVISLIVIGIVIIFCYCIIHNKKWVSKNLTLLKLNLQKSDSSRKQSSHLRVRSAGIWMFALHFFKEKDRTVSARETELCKQHESLRQKSAFASDQKPPSRNPTRDLPSAGDSGNPYLVRQGNPGHSSPPRESKTSSSYQAEDLVENYSHHSNEPLLQK